MAIDTTQLGSVIKELTDIRNVIDSLGNSNSIPRNIETAIKERLGLASLNLSNLVSSSGTTGSFSTQNISLTGNPQTITVPAQPSGTVNVTIGGTSYDLLYK